MRWLYTLLLVTLPTLANAEPLRLSEAVRLGQARYPSLAAKKSQVALAEGQARTARDAYLPDVTIAAQQSFGTVNGWFGPQMPVGLLGISSAGPVGAEQSWNAAFGANYLIGAGWEFLTFGRVNARIGAAEAGVSRAKADLEQERFVHQVKVAGTYLDLVVARELITVAEANLQRAEAVLTDTEARTKTGLTADVDRSLAESEVSRAKLMLIDATDRAQKLDAQLSLYIGESTTQRELDRRLLEDQPSDFGGQESHADNPILRYHAARVEEASASAKAVRRNVLPSLTLVTTLHSRASGFDANYTSGSDNYTLNYFDGIWPRRTNAVVALTLTWNLMSLVKNRGQANASESLAESHRQEQALSVTQLKNQSTLADQRLVNVRDMLREVPRQYDAAKAAHQQKSAMYQNGLSTFVEVQQALYALGRAEADRSVAKIALWQALLQKAAALGDYGLFSRQLVGK